MKTERIPVPRSRHELWEVRRPPPDERPAHGTRTPRSVPEVPPAHLVLANDAGDREDVLLGVAEWLAERTRCATRVVHVYDPPPAGELENIRRLAPTDHGGSVAEVCDRIVGLARNLNAHTGRPATPELLTGPIASTLADYIRANEFDLVTAVAGATWPSPWGCRVWYRAARVRPVMVVGPGTTREWLARACSSREVLALLDGTAGAERIVAPAVALSRMLDARLTLLRTVPRGGGTTDRYLLELAARTGHDVPAVRTIAVPGPAAMSALAAQRATDAVVALCAPASAPVAVWGPGRLAARLMRESPAPVLFYRPNL